MPIHVVVGGGILFAAYLDPAIANAHSLTITGSVVVTIELRDRLPDDVRDDVTHDFWDEEEETPVIEVVYDVPITDVDDGDPRR